MESFLSDLSSGYGAKLPRVANEASFYYRPRPNSTTSSHTLVCSLSKKIPVIPVRMTSCKHVDTVDLQAFLKSCPKSDLISLFAKYKLSSKVDSLLTCPLCKAKGSLYVDAIIENFIRANPSEESILFSIKNQGEHTFLYGSVLSSEVANSQYNEPTIKVSSVSDKYQEEGKFHWEHSVNSPTVWSMGKTVGQISVPDKMEKAMLTVKPPCVETMTSPRSPPLWWESHQSQPQRSPALWWETQGPSPHPCKTPIYAGTSTAPSPYPCKTPIYAGTSNAPSPYPCKTPIYTGTSNAPSPHPCKTPIYGQIPSSSCKSPMYSQAPALIINTSDGTTYMTNTSDEDQSLETESHVGRRHSFSFGNLLSPIPDVKLIPPSPDVLVNVN